jgi:hypothetical protein
MGILNTGDIIEQMQRDRTDSQSKVTQTGSPDASEI